MVSQAFTLLALFSLGLAPERPARTPPMPNGPQPEFATVSKIIPAQRVIIYLQNEVVIVPVAVIGYQNGRAFPKTVYQTANRVTERAFALEKGTITDAAGKKVSVADALKRLKVGATVLVADQPVDPLYLRVIQPDTLILVSDQVQAPMSIPVSPPPVFPGPKDNK